MVGGMVPRMWPSRPAVARRKGNVMADGLTEVARVLLAVLAGFLLMGVAVAVILAVGVDTVAPLVQL